MLKSIKRITQVISNQIINKIFYCSCLFVFVLSSCSSFKDKTTKDSVLADISTKKFNHHSGFLLVDIEKNKSLLSYNSDAYFIPASTTKLFTFYTSLKLLGNRIPSFKYYSKGDSILLMGTGDPTLLNPNFKKNDIFLSFLKDYKHLEIVLDNYTGEKYGPGWAWEDYQYTFSPEISSFPLYGNVLSVTATDTLELQPHFFAEYITRIKGKSLREERVNQFYIPPKLTDTLRIPFITSTSLTKQLLERRLNQKIDIAITPLNQEWQVKYGEPTNAVLKQMLVESDNFLAEQLMLMASSILGDTISFKASRDYMLENYLNDIEEKPRWVDGSGLSRYNLFTPKSMITILLKIHSELDITHLFELIPNWNAQGTLPTEKDSSYIYAKSGSMGNIYNLCGYLRTKSGKLLAFSFMNNNFRRPQKEIREHIYHILEIIHTTY